MNRQPSTNVNDRIAAVFRAIDHQRSHLEAALAACTPIDLARLDGLVRSRMSWSDGPLTAALKQSRPDIHLLGLASFDCDGCMREAAVQHLDARDEPRVLPFLLIRLTDWVPVIRSAAAAAVRRRLNADHASTLITCLPLLDRLGKSGRAESVEIVAAAREALRTPPLRTTLRDAIDWSKPVDARSAYALLLEGEPNDLLDVLGNALHPGQRRTDDNAIRVLAANRARIIADRDDVRALLAPLRNDRFMPVRRDWLYAQASNEAAVRPMLFDPHVSIREAARFYLRDRGIDFAAIYRAQIDLDPSAAAIAGLGETGNATDAPRVARFAGTDAAPVRTRATAIRAVARLDADGYLDLLHTAVNDPASGVSRAAFESLMARPMRVDAEKLWLAVTTPSLAVATRRALTLIVGQVWWDAAPWLIRATSVPAARDAALDHLKSWRGKVGRIPAWATAAQWEAFRAAVAAHRDTLDADARADADRLLAEARS